MRIVSLNCWGGAADAPDGDRLVPWCAAVEADVLCLQEVIDVEGGPRWLEYRDGAHVLPQRGDLLRSLQAALPAHACTFAPAARVPLRDGEGWRSSLWGIATFVRRDLPVTAQAQGFVHGAFESDGPGPHPRARTAHALRVHHPDLGGVAVAHLHGLRDPAAGKGDTPGRIAQGDRLAALLARVAEPGDRIAVTGDFNLEPSSAAFAPLRALGLRERATGDGHAGTRTALYPKPGRHADYMWTDAAASRFAVVRAPEISDHCPLVLDL